jgi:hypothetical protein
MLAKHQHIYEHEKFPSHAKNPFPDNIQPFQSCTKIKKKRNKQHQIPKPFSHKLSIAFLVYISSTKPTSQEFSPNHCPMSAVTKKPNLLI